MKKNISLCAIFFTVILLASCSLFSPLAGKSFTTNFLGVEYGFKFDKNSTYEEYSDLGVIASGTYVYDFKESTVTLTDSDGESETFKYDSIEKSLSQENDVFGIAYKLKTE